MARAHFVKKARKDYPEHGIAKGDSYYWWKFRYGGKRYSKTRPRPSQLTQSDFLSTVYAYQEQIEDIDIDPDDLQSVADELRSVAEELETLGQEQEDKIDNMPDSLQDSEVAELLRERGESCSTVAGDLEAAADEIEELGDEEENSEERARELIDNIDWSF